MGGLKWTIKKLPLQLKYTWKISRSSDESKTNFVVEVSDGEFRGHGEIAPNLRYGETQALVEEQFQYFLQNIPNDYLSIQHFDQLLNNPAYCQSLKFGLCAAYTQLLCDKENTFINHIYNLPTPLPRHTFSSIPIMEPSMLGAFYKKWELNRFKYLKLKVEKTTAIESIKVISSLGNAYLIIDANESWSDPDDFLLFEERLGNLPIIFFEQPLPAPMNEEMKWVKDQGRYEYMADESILHNPDWNELQEQFHAINVKMMKSGTYLHAIDQLNTAHNLGMKTLLGCMIESGLGIYGAFHLSGLADYLDLDGFMMLNNNPYPLIDEEEGVLFLRQ